MKRVLGPVFKRAKQDTRKQFKQVAECMLNKLMAYVDELEDEALDTATSYIKNRRAFASPPLEPFNPDSEHPGEWPLDKLQAEARKRSIPTEFNNALGDSLSLEFGHVFGNKSVPIDPAMGKFNTSKYSLSIFCSAGDWYDRTVKRCVNVPQDIREKRLRLWLVEAIMKHDAAVKREEDAKREKEEDMNVEGVDVVTVEN